MRYNIEINIFVALITQLASSENNTELTSTTVEVNQRKYAYVDGDFIIGAIIPVHDPPLWNRSTDTLYCGEINERSGIQRVDAALKAIDRINREKWIPGLNIGIHIRDDCFSEPLALYQTMNLIEAPKCTEALEHDRNIRRKPPLIGIAGPSSSGTAIQVQNFLKLFKIPLMSYAATATSLYDYDTYPYFLSVVPPNVYQVFVMLNIIKKYNWSYVSIVYTDNAYGQSGMNDFKREARRSKVCVAKSVSIPQFTRQQPSYYDQAVEHLLRDLKARVVVCFCEERNARELLKSVRRNNATGRYLFLGSNLWSHDYVKGYEEEAWGSIMVDVSTPFSDDRKESAEKPILTNHRNPWYQEFWEHKFRCQIYLGKNSTRRCTGRETLPVVEEDYKTFYLKEAIYIFALQLRAMRDEVCKDKFGACSKLYPFNSTKFMENLRSYNAKSDSYFYNGDTLMLKNNSKFILLAFFTAYFSAECIKTCTHCRLFSSYAAYNFQKSENGTFQYVRLGRFTLNRKNEDLHTSEDIEVHDFYTNEEAQFPNGDKKPIPSICSYPCAPGFRRVRFNNDPERECCWDCQACAPSEVLINETTCQSCHKGNWPNQHKTNCLTLPETYIQWNDLQSLVSLPFAIIGVVLTSITIFEFVKYRDTPVVKSSTRELCYLMLVAMISAHCTGFAIVVKPRLVTCILVRILPPLNFTVIYACLLVKTNRIARLLAMSKTKFPNPNPPFMSLKAQLVMTFCMITTELVVCFVALRNDSSTPFKHYNEDYVEIICPSSVKYVITSFLLVVLLALMCTVYAIKTRNLPGNFNEAKFIGFAMYTTCITWTAFVLIYYGSDFQVISISLCSTVNSLVILVFLFFPKLYIIIWVPERNTRANFTTTNGIRCVIGREAAPRAHLKRTLIRENDYSRTLELSSLNLEPYLAADKKTHEELGQ